MNGFVDVQARLLKGTFWRMIFPDQISDVATDQLVQLLLWTVNRDLCEMVRIWSGRFQWVFESETLGPRFAFDDSRVDSDSSKQYSVWKL